ncbi:hypothetical protein FRB93_009161 [Tulasnella sp. JGI-2019a]|nr:hypothetical protein FRB93_009161 [Tulasnella sp. JGI-2019a]
MDVKVLPAPSAPYMRHVFNIRYNYRRRPMADNLAAVNLAALILSVALWGLYVCLSIMMVLVLHRKKTWLASLPFYCMALIFVCNFGDTICVIFIACKSFLFHPEGSRVYFIHYYDRMIDHGWYAATSLFRCSAGFGAAILLFWRVFVIWSRDRRVIYLPTLFFILGLIGCPTIFVYDIWKGPNFSRDAGALRQYNGITVTLFVTDILNTWYCTGLICYRLCSVMRQKRAAADAYDDMGADFMAGSPHRKIVRVLIQSGMLFSVAEAAYLVCVLTGSRNGRYILDYMTTRIVGIGTVLIIIQLNPSPPPSSNLHQSPSGDSGSYSMPVFRRWVNEELTTEGVDTKGVSQSSTYDGGIEHMISSLAPYAEGSHKQSSAREDTVKHAISYSAPYEEQSHVPSSSTIATHNIV